MLRPRQFLFSICIAQLYDVLPTVLDDQAYDRDRNTDRNGHGKRNGQPMHQLAVVIRIDRRRRKIRIRTALSRMPDGLRRNDRTGLLFDIPAEQLAQLGDQLIAADALGRKRRQQNGCGALT